MAKLSVYLNPFSPDYSGVASVFFDLNALSVMHDAGGCTGNYTGYDEPRWYGSRAAVYCSGLREIDAIMGDDQKLINRVLDAQKDINPDVIVIIGSPVPMVVGCDTEGIAHEIEDTCGVPSFGFDVTGTRYYDYGMALACEALVRRFVKPVDKARKPAVNIIGSNAIDFGVTDTIAVLENSLKARGLCMNLRFPMEATWESLKRCAAAHVNVVVSRSGFSTAKLLYKEYGIPYVAGLPVGDAGAEEFFSCLDKTFEDGACRVAGQAGTGADTPGMEGETLILSEQIMANSLRRAICLKDGLESSAVTVGCIFGREGELADSHDIHLDDELSIARLMNDPRYSTIYADPLFKGLLKDEGKDFISIPHFGVSSNLAKKQEVNLLFSAFDGYCAAEKRR